MAIKNQTTNAPANRETVAPPVQSAGAALRDKQTAELAAMEASYDYAADTWEGMAERGTQPKSCRRIFEFVTLTPDAKGKLTTTHMVDGVKCKNDTYATVMTEDVALPTEANELAKLMDGETIRHAETVKNGQLVRSKKLDNATMADKLSFLIRKMGAIANAPKLVK
jgi:hypothetical protein